MFRPILATTSWLYVVYGRVYLPAVDVSLGTGLVLLGKFDHAVMGLAVEEPSSYCTASHHPVFRSKEYWMKYSR